MKMVNSSLSRIELQGDTGKSVLLTTLAIVAWLSVNQLFVVSEIDWLRESDSGWYWRVTQVLVPFDSAIVIGYPLIWRSLVEVFPSAPVVGLAQAINLLSYAIMVNIIYELLINLGVKKPFLAALAVALFPLTGIVSTIQPRPNALVHLLNFSTIFLYIKKHPLGYSLCVSLLLMLHRSVIPMVGLLTLVGLAQRRVTLKHLILILTPLLVYWILGIAQGQEPLWYLKGYASHDLVLGLPLADGLFGTLALGLRGNVFDLLQGLLLMTYWGFAIYLFATGYWKAQLHLLAIVGPVVFLGLIQPESEIFAMYNYTPYFAIAVLLFLQDRGVWPVANWAMTGVITLFISSQFVWGMYIINFLR